MKRVAAILDLDNEGSEADYAALFPDHTLIEIYHEPAAYFARVRAQGRDAREKKDAEQHRAAA